MATYYQDLKIEGETFEELRMGTNAMLNNLIKKMLEKDSMIGSLTIKIDIELTPDFIPVGDKMRRILVPNIEHKINSVVQTKSELKGVNNLQGMELIFDENENRFVLATAQTNQVSIYDREGEAEVENELV